MDEFNRFMNVNVTGTMLVTSIASSLMRNQDALPVDSSQPARGVTRGTIVVMGSAAAYIATPEISQYTASKHAVLGLAKNAGKFPPVFVS